MKNLLVLFPLVFSGHLTDPASLFAAAAAFVAFSLGASSVYIFYDLRDVEADRSHPRKKNRPIASGKVPIPVAVIIALVCLVLSFAIVILFAMDLYVTLVILGIYIVVNVGYSLGLKNVPIVDIAILASGFVFRVLFGGGMCGIHISSWLLLTILTLSVFLALGKRRGGSLCAMAPPCGRALKLVRWVFWTRTYMCTLASASSFILSGPLNASVASMRY